MLEKLNNLDFEKLINGISTSLYNLPKDILMCFMTADEAENVLVNIHAFFKGIFPATLYTNHPVQRTFEFGMKYGFGFWISSIVGMWVFVSNMLIWFNVYSGTSTHDAQKKSDDAYEKKVAQLSNEVQNDNYYRFMEWVCYINLSVNGAAVFYGAFTFAQTVGVYTSWLLCFFCIAAFVSGWLCAAEMTKGAVLASVKNDLVAQRAANDKDTDFAQQFSDKADEKYKSSFIYKLLTSDYLDSSEYLSWVKMASDSLAKWQYTPDVFSLVLSFVLASFNFITSYNFVAVLPGFIALIASESVIPPATIMLFAMPFALLSLVATVLVCFHMNKLFIMNETAETKDQSMLARAFYYTTAVSAIVTFYDGLAGPESVLSKIGLSDSVSDNVSKLCVAATSPAITAFYNDSADRTDEQINAASKSLTAFTSTS